jgi:hypothetical protein
MHCRRSGTAGDSGNARPNLPRYLTGVPRREVAWGRAAAQTMCERQGRERSFSAAERQARRCEPEAKPVGVHTDVREPTNVPRSLVGNETRDVVAEGFERRAAIEERELDQESEAGDLGPQTLQ